MSINGHVWSPFVWSIIAYRTLADDHVGAINNTHWWMTATHQWTIVYDASHKNYVEADVAPHLRCNAATYHFPDICNRNFVFWDNSQRGEDLFGTHIYHHAKFHADQLHLRRDICPWAEKFYYSDRYTLPYSVWRATNNTGNRCTWVEVARYFLMRVPVIRWGNCNLAAFATFCKQYLPLMWPLFCDINKQH